MAILRPWICNGVLTMKYLFKLVNYFRSVSAAMLVTAMANLQITPQVDCPNAFWLCLDPVLSCPVGNLLRPALSDLK